MIRRMILAAALAISSIAQPAFAQDSIASSTAPAPTIVRLPLVRLITDGDRVVMQVIGSTEAPIGSVNGAYVGPSGYVATAAEATDIKGTPGGDAVANPVPGPIGAPGKSAYQIWLDAGNEGGQSAFLASLRGPQGNVGGNGNDGAPGADGKSAYQLWLDAGNAGSAADFLASLTGSTGPAGPAGSPGSNGNDGAAAELRVQGGNIQWRAGTGAWANLIAIADLRGETGPAGATGGQGPAGSNGITPQLSIGTVTTLPAGSSATANLGGTTANPTLNLGLPAGATGSTGAQGPAASTNVVFLNNVTLAQTAIVAIALGPRQLTVSTNCVVGDRLFMSPSAALPAGYMLGDIFCSANGTAQATLYAPLLAVGAGYSITVKVTAFR